jgi:hypothetical protein
MKRTLTILVASLAFGLTSCGKSDAHRPTFPVSGQILLPDGKPAEYALVIFHPVGPADGPKPRGKVLANGTYQLTTFATDDGAPAGEYQVTVELWLPGRPDEGPSNRLNAKYAKPESSGLTATVGTGPAEIKTISLKR